MRIDQNPGTCRCGRRGQARTKLRSLLKNEHQTANTLRPSDYLASTCAPDDSGFIDLILRRGNKAQLLRVLEGERGGLVRLGPG